MRSRYREHSWIIGNCHIIPRVLKRRSALREAADMHETMIGQLEAIMQRLAEACGPAYTWEEHAVTVQLSHDRGMRLRRLLRESCPVTASELYRRQLEAGPVQRHGQHVYVLQIGEVSIEWPAREIRYALGKSSYI